MSRRTRTYQDRLDQVLVSLRRRFETSPLACVGTKLESLILPVQSILKKDPARTEDAEKLAAYIEAFMNRLPDTFGERFFFDAGMISALSEEWSRGGSPLSGMIIPRASKEWGYQSIPLPGYSDGNVDVIDIIEFPGGDSLDDIDLLDYPFLCHELGHNVLFKNDTAFGSRFEPQLNRFVASLQRRSLPDRGTAKQQAQRNVEEIRRLWRPSPDHRNWAHEIAVDVIALWTCGPAYLAVIHDILEADELNPCQVGQSHPPYEVRANALLAASDQIGWACHTGAIRRRIDAWRVSKWKRGRTNQYLTCASADLTLACVDSALAVCETLGLPLITPAIVGELEGKLRRGETPDFGSELLLAAWLRRNQMDENEFDAWEREMVSVLSASLRS